MPKSIAIVHNQASPSLYDKSRETKAVSSILACVEAVRQALLKLKYDVVVVPLSPPAEQVRETLEGLDVSLVFNLFEGFPGQSSSEPLVPQILSEIGKPYTGCSASALKKALDKFGAKKMLRAEGIATPDFQLLNPGKIRLFRLNFPCIVKPGYQDASHGITPESVINDIQSMERRINEIYENYHNPSLVEEYIEGREFNVTVIGSSRPEVLPVSEIIFTLPPEMPAILTFDAKWEEDSVYYKNTRVVCPAEITAKEKESVKKLVLAAFRLLYCSGYARIDMRMDKSGQLNVIEINPNPDISPEAGVAVQASAAGVNYNGLIEKIVKLALDRKKDGHKDSPHISFRQNRLITNIKRHARI
ncbi:MAG: ATP-grasp domain-containing protein [Dehalococcoidia bacterium]|jgi:D-alanine-D-alanine ligase